MSDGEERINAERYKSIALTLRDEILRGKYAAGSSLPSLTKIMQRFKVSRPCAVRSIELLKRMGLVVTRKGSGTIVNKTSRTIGLAIPGTADSEFFAAVKEVLVQKCREIGYDLVAGDVFAVEHRKRDKQAARLARQFIKTGVDGVIMQPVGFSENANRINRAIADVLGKAHIPLVLFDYDIATPPRRSRYDVVSIDNFNAGRRLGTHIAASGAKRVCCLLRRLCADSVHTRFAGVDAAVLRATGCHAQIVVAEPYDEAAIRSALDRHHPDAIVCSNDVAASMLAKTLRRLCVRIPNDVMLAGFDDVQLAASMSPPLTTMRQPCRELAITALRTLFERIRQPKLPPRRILLDAALVIRQSTSRNK